MITKELFKKIEKKYNLWLSRHLKGDHNYKSFSHMRRTVEFADYYAKQSTDEAQERPIFKHHDGFRLDFFPTPASKLGVGTVLLHPDDYKTIAAGIEKGGENE